MREELTIGKILQDQLALNREDTLLQEQANYEGDVPAKVDTGVEHGPYLEGDIRDSLALRVLNAHMFREINPIPFSLTIDLGALALVAIKKFTRWDDNNPRYANITPAKINPLDLLKPGYRVEGLGNYEQNEIIPRTTIPPLYNYPHNNYEDGEIIPQRIAPSDLTKPGYGVDYGSPQDGGRF